MIRKLGDHRGKNIVFGYDRHLLAEVSSYVHVMQGYGRPQLACDMDDPYYLTSAQRACECIQSGDDDVGILVCANGMGMSIAANKFRGVYAARCLDVDDARMARTVNNANVLCLAARATLRVNEAIIEAFMTTPYEGRKLDQLEYISCLELESDPAPRYSSAPRLLSKSA